MRITDAALVAAATLSHRYIADRFLPDKAIDLMDEAAARLRMEIDSMPEELDEIDRRLMQLEIEREALKKESDDRVIRLAPGEQGTHGIAILFLAPSPEVEEAIDAFVARQRQP